MQESIAISTTPPLPGLLMVQQANAAIQTVATDFAGDADPAAIAPPLSRWAQTSTGILFRRNAAGTAWVEIGKVLDRPLYSSDGATGVLPTGGFRNKIINGRFAVNQRLASGTVTLTAGSYGHDRFKAGASGCTYTFSTNNGVTILTITAGSLVQVIDGLSIVGGVHTLSWQGSATGRINTDPFGPSPQSSTLIGGANASVEFGVGTLSLVQLESGATANAFEVRPFSDDLASARAYYRGGVMQAGSYFTAHAVPGSGVRFSIPIGEPMRIASPTAGIDIGNWQIYSASNGWTSMAWSSTAVESGLFVTTTFVTPSQIPAYSSAIIRNTVGANYFLSAEL